MERNPNPAFGRLKQGSVSSKTAWDLSKYQASLGYVKPYRRHGEGVGEMARKLRVLSALPENLASVSSTRNCYQQFTMACNSNSKRPVTLFWFLWYTYMSIPTLRQTDKQIDRQMCTHMHTRTHHNLKINFFKFILELERCPSG